MEVDTYNNLINILSAVSKDDSLLPIVHEEIDPSYMDINGNNYFHYLSKFTFNEYILFKISLNKIDVKYEKDYNKLLQEYLKTISIFVNILNTINCDIFCLNNKNQNPLYMCFINDNYHMANEYYKSKPILLNSIFNYYKGNILIDVIENSGNSFKKEFIELLSSFLTSYDYCFDKILSLINEPNKNMINLIVF